jgi:hypothetical protein
MFHYGDRVWGVGVSFFLFCSPGLPMLVSDIGFPRCSARMASGMEPAHQTVLKEARPGGWAIGRNREEIKCRGVFISEMAAARDRRMELLALTQLHWY